MVLSSRWEGLPLTPIETFAEKKTIIASNIIGNNEIVKDGINGLLFEKDDVNELFEKINILVDNAYLRNQMERNAYKDYVEKYSYQKFKDDYANLYQS